MHVERRRAIQDAIAQHAAPLRIGLRRCHLELRSVELGFDPADLRERAKAERAFNILAQPDLRHCYDRMSRDEDAPPLFPYGGFGSIFVAGSAVFGSPKGVTAAMDLLRSSALKRTAKG